MKFARGFKKRYFSLKAITALASQLKISRALERVKRGDVVVAFGGEAAADEEEKSVGTAQVAQCAAALLLIGVVARADISIDAETGAEIVQKNGSDITLKDQLNHLSNFTQNSTLSIGSIDGAPARFTKVYWEGIELKDTTGITAEPTYINSLLLSSDRLSILGNSIYLNSDTKQPSSILVGGSNRHDRYLSGKIKIDSAVTGVIELENKTAGNRTTIAKTAGALDKRSEPDETEATTIKTVLRFAPTDRLDLTIKALDAISKEDYDGWDYSLNDYNPNDNAAYWDNHLMIGGFEAGYLFNSYLGANAGINYTKTKRIDSDHDRYIGTTRTVFGEVKTVFDGIEINVGAKNSLDEADISGQIDDSDKQSSVFINSVINTDHHRFDLTVAENILKNTTDLSYGVSWKLFVSAVTLRLNAKKEVKAPTIYQKLNPWGETNKHLTHEALEQKLASAALNLENLSLQTVIYRTDIYDYINWVNIPPFSGKYENVDRVKFNGVNLFAKFFIDDKFVFGGDFTKIFNYNSSDKSTENRQIKSVVTVFTNYRINRWLFGAEFRGTASYYDGTHKMNGERSNAVTAAYAADDHLTIELAVKNITNEYRETIYGYTPNTPERTLFLSVKKSFNAY